MNSKNTIFIALIYCLKLKTKKNKSNQMPYYNHYLKELILVHKVIIVV